MNLHIHPKGRRVLVKADDLETVTPAGIVVVTDEKLERAGQMRGTLVAAGDLAFKGFVEGKETPWANIGDWVLYARYAGKRVDDPVTEEEYIILNDEDILATLDRE